MSRDHADKPAELDAYESAIAELQKAKARIEVPDRLRKPCALVKEASAALRGQAEDDQGIVRPPNGCLDIQVSKAQLPRALRVADALLKTTAQRGWEARVKGGATIVHVGGVEMSLSIFEVMETVEVPMKPALDEKHYAFYYQRQHTTQRPSGRLSIGIQESERIWRQQCRRNWRGAEEKPVEIRLHQVLIGMLRLASAVVSERAEQERKKREEHAREEAKLAALEEQSRLRSALAREKANVELLLSQTARWHESEEIRQFVAHVEAQGCLPELGLKGEDLARWRAWALEQADRIDPFAPSSPSILDRSEEIERLSEHGPRYR